MAHTPPWFRGSASRLCACANNRARKISTPFGETWRAQPSWFSKAGLRADGTRGCPRFFPRAGAEDPARGVKVHPHSPELEPADPLQKAQRMGHPGLVRASRVGDTPALNAAATPIQRKTTEAPERHVFPNLSFVIYFNGCIPTLRYQGIKRGFGLSTPGTAG